MLGKSLINDRFRKRRPTQKVSVVNQRSVTERDHVTDFLHQAALAGAVFASEKTCGTIEQFNQETEPIEQILRIPRRPQWCFETSRQDLEERESIEFVNWRRSLALFQEHNNVTMTPYEKNLQVWRQLWRVLEKSHVVIQIVDARNPMLFYCPDVFLYAKELSEDKKTMVLLNKADLLTAYQRQVWGEYLDGRGLEFAFYSANNVMNAANTASCLTGNAKDSGDILSRNQLVEKLKTLDTRRSNATVVGLVGYPNVGKSSTINSLLRSKQVSVACAPGRTKHFQTLFLDRELCLCDCPGLVFPNFAATRNELVVGGILPVDQIKNCLEPCGLVIDRVALSAFEKLYKIKVPISNPEQKTPESRLSTILDVYTTSRWSKNSKCPGGRDKAARIILKDYIQGRLLYVHPPSGTDPVEFNEPFSE